jgi:CPA2 family monovalent cation:H+ antiporter-2
LDLVFSLLLVLAYLLLARYLGPPLVRFMETLSDELVLLLGAFLTAGTALLFHAAGASEGVGAFLSGVVAASLGLRERLEHLFGPVRDLGVALFFLVVGAQALGLLESLSKAALWGAGLGLLMKLPLNLLGGKAAGLGRKRRFYGALYLLPRGEFNLVLGALALGQGYPLVAQVAVLLVLVSVPLGALLIRFAPELYRALEGRGPKAAKQPS